jgi:ribosomal protein S18 acetylase RimI-like enzyme
MLEVRDFIEDDRQAVIALWQRCGLTRPWNDPSTDIDLAINGTTSTVLVGMFDATIVASVMVGFDGHRGWVYYLAVDPDHARQGHGSTMMAAAENWLAARSAPKLELMVRDDNAAAIGFYAALGYEPQKVSVLAKWLDGRD